MNSSTDETMTPASATAPVFDIAHVDFVGANEFEIGDIKFGLAQAMPATTADRALLYKDKEFLLAYMELLPPMRAKRVFELGIYQGGSALFLTAFLKLEKYVCIDYSDPILNFVEMLKLNPIGERIRPFFNTSQDDADGLRAIIEAEFGDDLPDLIIDDASHHYDLTKRSFEITFPYLKDGGHYIIEDWSWAHWPENQSPESGWTQLPAMSNLILELALLLPSTDMIESIVVKQGFVILKKKASRFSQTPLSIDALLRLRGKNLSKI